MERAFTKMHGLGNDFVVVDARTVPFELDDESAQRIADRRTGVGGDLEQVQTHILGLGQGVGGLHHSELGAIFEHDPDGGLANAAVDTRASVAGTFGATFLPQAVLSFLVLRST